MIGFEILELWASIFIIDLIRYFVGVGFVLAILFVFKNKLRTRKIQKVRIEDSQRKREIKFSIMTVAIYATVGVFTFSGVQSGYFKIYSDINIESVSWAFLSFPLLLLIHDSYFYWIHRLLHWKKLFKHAHRMHHLSKAPTPWTAYSFNPIEAILMALFVPVYSYIFSVYDLTLIIYLSFMIVRNAAGHSGYEFFPRGFTNNIFGWNTTNVHHDMHHQSFNYNYALYFTWWDRWLATEHPEYHKNFDQITDSYREE